MNQFVYLFLSTDVVVSFTVNFNIDQLNQPDITTAYTNLTNTLNSYVTTGQFTTAIRAYATLHNLPALLPADGKSVPTTLLFTNMPTALPTSSPVKLPLLSDDYIIGLSVGGGGFLLIVLIVGLYLCDQRRKAAKVQVVPFTEFVVVKKTEW